MEFLEDYPFIKEIPVYWGDMDAFRHVNNTVYFRYFEIARIAYFEELKVFQLKDLSTVGPILVSTSAKYLKPLSYPDTVSVGVKSIHYSSDKVVQSYRIVSQRHKYVVTEGEGVIFGYDYDNMKRAPIPQKVLNAIAALEKKAKP